MLTDAEGLALEKKHVLVDLSDVLAWLFVALLLMRISGVPMLERKADERWGGQPDYESYKARTPVLVPRPPRAE